MGFSKSLRTPGSRGPRSGQKPGRHPHRNRPRTPCPDRVEIETRNSVGMPQSQMHGTRADKLPTSPFLADGIPVIMLSATLPARPVVPHFVTAPMLFVIDECAQTVSRQRALDFPPVGQARIAHVPVRTARRIHRMENHRDGRDRNDLEWIVSADRESAVVRWTGVRPAWPAGNFNMCFSSGFITNGNPE
jgi:hypothetical protein